MDAGCFSTIGMITGVISIGLFVLIFGCAGWGTIGGFTITWLALLGSVFGVVLLTTVVTNATFLVLAADPSGLTVTSVGRF